MVMMHRGRASGAGHAFLGVTGHRGWPADRHHRTLMSNTDQLIAGHEEWQLARPSSDAAD